MEKKGGPLSVVRFYVLGQKKKLCGEVLHATLCQYLFNKNEAKVQKQRVKNYCKYDLTVSMGIKRGSGSQVLIIKLS